MRISKDILLVSFSFITIICVDFFVHITLEELPIEARSTLSMFVVVLATVSALIFTIPLFSRNSREETLHFKSDKKYVASYLGMFLFGISISLFTLVGIIKLTSLTFKLSLIMFLDCLIILVPYLFIFLRRNTMDVMKKKRNSILDDLNRIPFVGRRVRIDQIEEKIDDLERITMQALSNHNYVALDFSINCLKRINHEIVRRTKTGNDLLEMVIGAMRRTKTGNDLLEMVIGAMRRTETGNDLLEMVIGAMRRTEISIETGNILIKGVMRSFRDLGVACIECKSDEYSRQMGKFMREIIVDGFGIQKNLEYPNFVLYLERIAVEAARKHQEEMVDEILHNLGRIGDRSIRTEGLKRPPTSAILKSLQNIGIACAEEKMIHQCATARTRIFGIAQLGKQENREDIVLEALARFWIVTAYMYTNIPEVTEANYELETSFKKEFGVIFFQAIDEAIEILRKEREWVRIWIVKKFKSTSEFFNK